MAAGWLTLVCALAVLYVAKAQDPYGSLPEIYKKGVDLALEQLHSFAGLRNHYRFLRSLDKSDMESGFRVKYVHHHFYLKATHCSKGAAMLNPNTCPFRNDRPLMDCVVCYKTLSDEIQTEPKPYLHCMQKLRLTEDMKATRLENCRKMSYNSGAPTLLAISMG